MAEAKAMKLREYNPDLLKIESSQYSTAPASASNIRKTNTFNSTALSNEPITVKNKHNNIFANKPLQQPVMRASYQDSNIFTTDRATT